MTQPRPALSTLLRQPGLALVACTALFCAPTLSAQTSDQHIINLQQADIRAFIDDIAIVTGKTFLIDPRVQGNVTIATNQPLTKDEAFATFKDVMRIHGYTLTATSGTETYRISIIQTAAQNAPLNASPHNSEFTTAIFTIAPQEGRDIIKLVRPFLHTNGAITASSTLLIVSDFPENIEKVRQFITATRQSQPKTKVIPLRHIRAEDAINALKTLTNDRKTAKFSFISDTNHLLVKATDENMSAITKLITEIDQPASVPQGNLSVISLRFADGESLLELLSELLPNFTDENKPKPTIGYESASNSLVISADHKTRQALTQLIQQLDIRRPQVLVEAIIVEISDTAALELGVQFALSDPQGDSIPLIGTNFSRQAPNLLSLAGALIGPNIGLPESTVNNLQNAAIGAITGLNGGGIGGAVSNDNSLFTAVITALETDEESNILSKPFITTLDNVPATFLVGQEIPITTGESLGSNNVNPFRTFERKEIGIKLDILPQISEGDVVRLEITQEVSSISGNITNLAQDFVTNKRSLSTTVLADNGEIIVLGGLLRDDEQLNIAQVPLLGDIPVLGQLFRSKGRSRVKTNLAVFLRPTILRSKDDITPLTSAYLDEIRAVGIQQSGRAKSKLDDSIPVFDSSSRPEP